MVKKVVGLVIIVSIGLFAWWYHTANFGSQLPSKFPSTIPIIQGKIVDSRESIFDDGKGYVIGIESPKTYDEAIRFYTEEFKKNGTKFSFTEAYSEDKMILLEAVQGNTIIYIEIISKKNYTYVNIAVHLCKWFLF